MMRLGQLAATTGLAALAALPLWLLLALRFLVLARRMDRTGRRRLRSLSLLFAAASFVVVLPLCAWKGALALPVFPEILLSAVAALVITGMAAGFGRKRD